MTRSLLLSLCLLTLVAPGIAQAKPTAYVCHYPVFGNETGMKKYGKQFELKIN